MRSYIMRFTLEGSTGRVFYENNVFTSTNEALTYIRKIVTSCYNHVGKGIIIAESKTPFSDDEYENIVLTDTII